MQISFSYILPFILLTRSDILSYTIGVHKKTESNTPRGSTRQTLKHDLRGTHTAFMTSMTTQHLHGLGASTVTNPSSHNFTSIKHNAKGVTPPINHTQRIATQNTTNPQNITGKFEVNNMMNHHRTCLKCPNSSDSFEPLHGSIVYAWVFFTRGTTTTPVPYPNDPYNDFYWNGKLGWLTDEGKQQLFDLGNWFANKYFCCTTYSPETVKMLSDQEPSIFMSAECLLAGFFPHKNNEPPDQLINWQPIPIQTPTMEMLALTSSSTLATMCPQYGVEITETEGTSPWNDLSLMHKNDFHYIANHSGYDFGGNALYSTLQEIYTINDDLQMEELNNLSLPEWTPKVYPQLLQSMALDYLQLMGSSDRLQRLQVGPTLAAVIQAMHLKTQKLLEEELKLFAGNEASVASIMVALGLFNNKIPPRGSALLVELRKKEKSYYITVKFKNSSSDPYQLVIPGCGLVCNFNKFVHLLQAKIPNSWDSECTNVSIVQLLSLSTPLVISGLVAIIVLIFLAILLIVKCGRCLKKRKARISSV